MLHLHTTCLHLHTAFCCRRKLFPFILLLNMCTVFHPSTWELSGVDSAHLHSITHLMHISSWISFTFHDVISANRKSILNSKCWTPSHNMFHEKLPSSIKRKLIVQSCLQLFIVQSQLPGCLHTELHWQLAIAGMLVSCLLCNNSNHTILKSREVKRKILGVWII